MSEPYAPPVDQLLTLGDADENASVWDDYSKLGIGPEHIPELIRMATDPELNEADYDSTEALAPAHAWRALGQLRAPEAAEPLLRTLTSLPSDHDWAYDELPEVLAQIGPPVFSALAGILNDDTINDWIRVAAGDGLTQMVEHYPDVRDEVVRLLAHVVEHSDRHSRDLTTFAAADLLNLKAAEAAPVIERALAKGHVYDDAIGDWEDVQVELGLLPDRITPRSSPAPGMMRDDYESDEGDGSYALPPRRVPTAAQHAKNKAKKKAEKKARKKNRRR